VSNTPKSGPSRRELLKTTGQVAAASALAGVLVPQVHAGGSNAIQLALVGCGGRGGGAIDNALATRQGPTKLVALADVFRQRVDETHRAISQARPRQVDVPESRRYVGFDAYRHAMDSLNPGDVVILTTPPAFRWVHFAYAIEKRLNVFMEKPISVDGPSTRRMIELAGRADERNLKVGVGLMCRHCEARKELYGRIRDGQIGDITFMRAYRMHGPVGHCFVRRKPEGISELLWQVREFHSFIWASGGLYSDFYIHHIDECCWMKDGWPVSARALGGRNYRGDFVDQNFDTYSVEYTFADGAKLFLEGRTMDRCEQQFASYAHGTRGSAVISEQNHSPAHCRTYRTQNMARTERPTWSFGRAEPDPYQLEWENLMTAIRANRPHNEVRRGAEASLVTAMGRWAAHTGQVITLEQMRAHTNELAPQLDRLTMDSAAPLRADNNGKYPVPTPGRRPEGARREWREYYVG
jgi:predicted dehydrogenase